MPDKLHDILVVGGGINGVGIAADAAGRGLNVLLCEQNDLASGTSSASSKLIHGGLRYLEQYALGLVRESLQERTLLQGNAPLLIKPLRFLVPYIKNHRPFWLIRLGLWVYDRLSPSHIERSTIVYFQQQDPHNPLISSIRKGFAYSDCTVDDARLVIINALQAKRKGASILTHTKCIHAMRKETYWEIQLHDTLNQEITIVKTKAFINATGPWINDFIDKSLEIKSSYRTSLVKGSHIIVPKLYDAQQAYLLQHTDKRIVFVIPYHHQFTLIGTTDVAFSGDPHQVKIDDSEIDYLCQLVNKYFSNKVHPRQIIASWSGVRSLFDDLHQQNLAALQRGYKLEILTNDQGNLPLVNIFGGKLTTYRQLAEKVMNSLSPYFPQSGKAWTSKAPLPGQELSQNLKTLFPWLPNNLSQRYMQNYGSLALHFLKEAKSLEDLGQDFGHDLYEKEVNYLIHQEWALTCEDILWRRTKLGLFFTPEQEAILATWIKLCKGTTDPL